MIVEITPSLVAGTLTAPSSKSYAQRAVAVALLANGRSTLTNMGLCGDTSAALDVAQRLGAQISHRDTTYTIEGGFAPTQSTIDIGESGLATRLFTPIAALSDQAITVTGHGSILSRPIDMMRAPLEALGAKVHTNGFLPLTVQGALKGGEATVDGAVSSQFLTGLLIALPLAGGDTVLTVAELKSIPYINMTLDVMRAFGVDVVNEDYKRFIIQANRGYTATQYNIEGDWSGASCLLVAGATAGEITVENLNPCSLQADRAILDALRQAGAKIEIKDNDITVIKSELKAFDFDATDCPDLFPALVALAASCRGVSSIKGTTRLTHKESDRAKILALEFGKLGIAVDISTPDIMLVTGGTITGGKVDSHNDHRIAMATAVAAFSATDAVTIERAEAVAKSYPTFWKELATLTL